MLTKNLLGIILMKLQSEYICSLKLNPLIRFKISIEEKHLPIVHFPTNHSKTDIFYRDHIKVLTK